MTNLTLNNLNNLKILNCRYNQLTSLDLESANQITNLHCSDNQLTTLNVNNLINLASLICYSNQLTHLYIKNGSSFYSIPNGYFNPIGNPLLYVCCDEDEVIQVINQVNSNFCNVGTFCDFTPGGNYNTISGTVKIDTNGNGCDTADPVFPNIKLKSTKSKKIYMF